MYVTLIVTTSRYRRKLVNAQLFLNTFFLVIVLFTLLQAITKINPNQSTMQKESSANTPLPQPSIVDSPDIYYIVVDGYSRQDFLDSEPFDFLIIVCLLTKLKH